MERVKRNWLRNTMIQGRLTFLCTISIHIQRCTYIQENANTLHNDVLKTFIYKEDNCPSYKNKTGRWIDDVILSLVYSIGNPSLPKAMIIDLKFFMIVDTLISLAYERIL